MAVSDPVTHKQILAWVVGAFVVALLGGFTFSTSIVSRAEASAQVAVDAKINAIVRESEARILKRIDELRCELKPTSPRCR